MTAKDEVCMHPTTPFILKPQISDAFHVTSTFLDSDE